MAKYTDNNKWEEQILIVDEQTPVLGGQPEWDAPKGMLISGFSNISAAMLADRTRFLKDKVYELEESISEGGEGTGGVEDAPDEGVFLRQEEKWIELEAGDDIELDDSDPDKIVVNYTGTKIIALTQEEYDLITPDPDVLYIILEDE